MSQACPNSVSPIKGAATNERRFQVVCPLPSNVLSGPEFKLIQRQGHLFEGFNCPWHPFIGYETPDRGFLGAAGNTVGLRPIRRGPT